MSEIRTIARERLEEWVGNGSGMVLIEVLGPASYERGHLPGARRAQTPDEAEALVPSKDTTVVAYCSNFH